MKIITINLPDKFLSAIQVLNDLGIYPSRSEAIRTALKDFLQNELDMFKELDDEYFTKLVRSVANKRK
jgi:Arc/MetJ-type ribon-helix-helix transcriptional regulator